MFLKSYIDLALSRLSKKPVSHNKVAADNNITTPGRRYHELDSLRGFASLTVFFSHFLLCNTISGPIYSKMNMSLLHLLWDGEAAVLFFFVLSGFVLALPYVNHDRPVELLGFYNKRVLRIYPAFVVTILLCLVLKHYVYNPDNMQHYSTWLSGIWKWTIGEYKVDVIRTFFLFIFDYNTELINPPIWSLSIEMRVSLLLPFLIILINKSSFLFNGLFVILLLYIGIDFYTTTFYFGIMLAKYHRIIGAYIRNFRGVVIGALFVIAAVLYANRFALNIGNNPNNPSRLHLYNSITGACLFILLAIYQPGFSRFLKNKFCLFLGKVSYSFYLVHMPILITVASLYPYTSHYSFIPIFLISLSISWLVSFIMFKLIEIPFQNLASRIVKKHSFFSKVKLS